MDKTNTHVLLNYKIFNKIVIDETRITRDPWATLLTWETSLNTFEQSYDYIITLIRRGKKTIISFLSIDWSLVVYPWVPFTQGSFVENDPVVLEEKVFKFRQCIFTISKLPPLGKLGSLHLNKLESPSTKDGPMVLEKKIFKFRQYILANNIS